MKRPLQFIVLKKYWLILFLYQLLSGSASYAQVSAYSFSQSTGSYSYLLGATIVGMDGLLDNDVFTVQLPFSFTFNNATYTEAHLSANGYIAFGLNPGITKRTISESAFGFQSIAAWSKDLAGQPGSIIQWEVSGASPNRVFTAEWIEMKDKPVFAFQWQGYNFQIRLHETTNAIDIEYGNMITDILTTGEVGLRGFDNTDFYNRTGTTNWSATVQGTTNTDFIPLAPGIPPASGLTFSYTPPPACGGFATAGTLSASVSTACANTAFLLSLVGSTSGFSGVDFEWQSSPPGLNDWTTMSGVSGSSYAVFQDVPTDYRIIVTCQNTGMSDTSNAVSVGQNAFLDCYCTDNLGGDDMLSTIDQVSITGTALNNVTPGATSPFYTVYPTTLTLMQGLSYTMNVVFSSFYSAGAMWIDYNRNSAFESDEWTEIAQNAPSGSASFTVPLTAQPGITIMRVRSRESGNPVGPGDACSYLYYGETQDYIIEIVPFASCSGTPAPGTASATIATACPASPFALELVGYSQMAGIAISWESSPAGTGNFSPIAGANSPILNLPGQIEATDYRAEVSCGSMVAYSNTVEIAQGAYYECYCSPLIGVPLHSSFVYNTIDSVKLFGTTLNTSNLITSPDGYILTQSTGIMEQGGSYVLKVSHGFSTVLINGWIDWDHSGTFDTSEYLVFTQGAAASTYTINVSPTALAGPVMLRLRSSNGYILTNDRACDDTYNEETEDYLLEVVPAAPCTGSVLGGIVISSSQDVCPSEQFDLLLDGASSGQGITYQWESAPAGSGLWTPLAGATSSSYTVPGQTVPTEYRAVVTCTLTSASAVSATATIGGKPFYYCYCSPVTGVTLHNPAVGFTNSPANYIVSFRIFTTSLMNFSGFTSIGGYMQYPPTSANTTCTLTISSSYNLRADEGALYNIFPEKIAAWIDYDHSGTFDAQEYIHMTSSSSSSSIPSLGTFTVPSTAIPGLTGLRVRAGKDTLVDISACSAVTGGETEDYVITLDLPLQMRLQDITAVNRGNYNLVQWSTASEDKGDYFIVEKSIDGQSFEAIGTVAGKEVSSSYEYKDLQPTAGLNYYRLKLMTVQGEHQYSKTVSAFYARRDALEINAYPSPAGNFVNISITGSPQGKPALSILDITGKTIAVAPYDGKDITINLTGYAAGIYFVRYVDDVHSRTVRITKI